MSDLPSGWAQSTLGEVCSPPQYGWTTSASSSGDVRLLRTTDITSGAVNWESVPFCLEAPTNVEKYLLDDGDIVVSRAGSVGKSLLIQEPQRSVFASYLIRFRPRINARFLAHFLNSGAYWKQITEQAAGIALPNINASKLGRVQLPIAPEPEQQRIVSKIDELFSRIDEGERALERVQKLVARYRQSVLKAAVTGELTRGWREKNKDKLESGEALLARILKARREAWEKAELEKMKAKDITPANDKWKLNYEEPPTLDTSGLPELPSGWVWTNLAQIKLFSLYGPRFSSEDYAESGYLVLRTSDISESGRVNVATAPKLRLSSEEFQKYMVEKGDLLITRTGSLGTLALFDDDVDAIPGAYLIQFRVPAPSVTRWYLFHFLKSPVGQHRLLTGGAGIGRPNLNAPTIEAIPIPLPPLEEQGAVVDRIDRTLESVEKQLELLGMEASRSQALRQATLKAAFGGELVAQDPADEPASALLERIAAERATTTAAPKRGRKKKSTA